MEGRLNVKFGKIIPKIIASFDDFEYASRASLFYENNCPTMLYLGSLVNLGTKVTKVTWETFLVWGIICWSWIVLWDGWPTNSRKPYFQMKPWSGSLTFMTSKHAEVGIDPGLKKQQSALLPLHNGAITITPCNKLNINQD